MTIMIYGCLQALPLSPLQPINIATSKSRQDKYLSSLYLYLYLYMFLFVLVFVPINKYKKFQTKSWQMSIVQIFGLDIVYMYKGSPLLERILDVQFKFYLARFHLNMQLHKQWHQPAFVCGGTFHKNWSRFHFLMILLFFSSQPAGWGEDPRGWWRHNSHLWPIHQTWPLSWAARHWQNILVFQEGETVLLIIMTFPREIRF